MRVALSGRSTSKGPADGRPGTGEGVGQGKGLPVGPLVWRTESSLPTRPQCLRDMGLEAVLLSCCPCHYRTQLSCALLDMLTGVLGWPALQASLSSLVYMVYKWLRCVGSLLHWAYARLLACLALLAAS